MSKADIIFKNMCEDILKNGTNTKNQKVRPHWDDMEPAYTIKQFGVCNKYDLREEFPAITFRKTAIKSATDEVLWIYQKKSPYTRDLNSHIWDQWADKNTYIGAAYGYQIGRRYVHHKEKINDLYRHFDDYKRDYPSFVCSKNMQKKTASIHFDQMDAVIYDLKHEPYSRRIMTNMYNFKDLHNMHLYPCAYSTTWNVTDEGYDKPILNLLLNQRSCDTLTANNWNVCQYAVLLMMVAQVVDMIPGQLVHMIADAHIYDRHVKLVEELINRPMYDAPKVTLDPDIKNFYDFTRNSVTVKNYKTGDQINIPVAI